MMEQKREQGSGIALPRLRAWRYARLLTQGELAEAAGVTLSTVARIEQGYNARLATVKALAAALGVEPHMLWTAAGWGEPA